MFRFIGNLIFGFINIILIPITSGLWVLVLGFIWFIKKLFGIGR